MYGENMRKIILAIFLVSLSLRPVAYSQDPPPPPTQEKIKIKTDRAKKDVSTKTDKKPSQNRMPIVVNKVHTTKNDTHPQHPGTKSTDGSKGTEPKEKVLLGITDFFNFLLVVFTGALVICNIKLWKAAKKSADAAKESIELVKQGFFATHRPKLRVHSIWLRKLDSTPDFINDSKPIMHQVVCSISNTGKTTATIRRMSIKFERLNKPLPVPSYSNPNVIEQTIASGDTVTKSCDVGAFVVDCSIDREVNDLYFFGYIDYRDDIGTIRRTAFCRLYNRETKRFTKVDDEDYEYSY